MATAGGGRGAGPERAFHAPLPAAGTVRLEREEGRHLVRVRRVRVGAEVVLFDGEGATRLARLLDDSADGPSLEILGDYPDREPVRSVAMAVALPAAGRSDDLVAALAELGVALLLPISAERSSDRRDLYAERRVRWQRIARESAKVNGRSRLLRIEPPIEVGAVLAWAAAATPPWSPIVLDPDPALPRLPALLRPGAAPLLLVGPEGGWTSAEVESLVRGGVPAARLGECALRTETAALVAAGMALGI